LNITRKIGEKIIVAVTCTCSLSPTKPGADALMVAVPKLTPVICGWVAGVVDLDGMNTVEGDMVTFVVSLLASVTVTPFGGAPIARFTWNGRD